MRGDGKRERDGKEREREGRGRERDEARSEERFGTDVDGCFL